MADELRLLRMATMRRRSARNAPRTTTAIAAIQSPSFHEPMGFIPTHPNVSSPELRA